MKSAVVEQYDSFVDFISGGWVNFNFVAKILTFIFKDDFCSSQRLICFPPILNNLKSYAIELNKSHIILLWCWHFDYINRYLKTLDRIKIQCPGRSLRFICENICSPNDTNALVPPVGACANPGSNPARLSANHVIQPLNYDDRRKEEPVSADDILHSVRPCFTIQDGRCEAT